VATKTKAAVPSELPVTPTPKTKKRGQYKQKECPYCHIHVGNLGNHIRLKHPVEFGAAPPVELTKENLLGVPTKSPVEIKPEEVRKAGLTYYCQDCKAELRQGENPCWNCGATLVWEEI
jgi:hypothetical protein